MSDPFARIRERRAERAAARASFTAEEQPVQVYEAIYLSRGWGMLLTLAYAPVMFGIVVLLAVTEHQWRFPYSTGVMVFAMLFLFASLLFPMLIVTSRRVWRLFADRIEISHRPLIPPFGAYKWARIQFAGITAARLGEMINGMHLFEIETRSGRRFRLTPASIGSGKAIQIDHAGFDAFIETIRSTIDRSGVPRPPGEPLRTATSGYLGIVILAVISACFAALALFGVWTVLQGEAIGIQALGFSVPFLLLFGGLLRDRWRKWSARP